MENKNDWLFLESLANHKRANLKHVPVYRHTKAQTTAILNYFAKRTSQRNMAMGSPARDVEDEEYMRKLETIRDIRYNNNLKTLNFERYLNRTNNPQIRNCLCGTRNKNNSSFVNHHFVLDSV